MTFLTSMVTTISRLGFFGALVIASEAADLLVYYDFNDQLTDQSGGGANAVLAGGAQISADAESFRGTAGDRSLDLGTSGNSARAEATVDFSSATPANAMAVSFWQYNLGDGVGGNASTTLFGIPSSFGGGKRGFQAHVPWGDGNLYFDHGGTCCDGAARRNIPLGISTLNQWKHFVLQVANGRKEIWIDGAMVDAQASGAAAIPIFTGQLMVGAEPAGTNNGFGGRIDEFAVWADFLTPVEIARLAGGESATDLGRQNPDLAEFKISPPSMVTSTGATLNGVVTNVGVGAPSITFFYGDEDGGQNEASWDNSVILRGSQS
ncbi:MAG: hypothetical protein ACJAVK_001521 [Akkermansiaceae bacterium]|jgi:hypothetical protein